MLQVNINNYKRSDLSAEIKEELIDVIKRGLFAARELQIVDVFDLMGNRSDHSTGGNERLAILIDTTSKDYSDNDVVFDQECPSMFGIENTVKKLHTIEGSGTVITSEEGYAVAEYFHTDAKHTLHIAFNMLDNWNEDMKVILSNILKHINAIYEKELLRFQWNSDNRARIEYEIKQRLVSHEASAKRDAERRLVDANSKITLYKQEMVKYIRLGMKYQNELDKFNEFDGKIATKFISDLDLIQQLDKVQDVRVENGVIHMFTSDLIIHDQNGNRYFGGKYRVEFDPSSTNVKFYGGEGNEGRHGYWTHNDPHPHVNGQSGNACLGNVDSTIAELSAQYEIYALANILIDFLESVNTDDSAGRKVTRWDRVDDDGNIIPAGTGDHAECGTCDANLPTSQLVTCYETGRQVCTSCRRTVISADGDQVYVGEDDLDAYTWNETFEIYVHDNFDGDLSEVLG